MIITICCQTAAPVLTAPTAIRGRTGGGTGSLPCSKQEAITGQKKYQVAVSAIWN
jgi:hypothetical protein